MAHIEIRPAHYGRIDARLCAEIVELPEAWTIQCNGDQIGDECPYDFEPGDTWSSLEPAVQDALRHIQLHETKNGPIS